MTAKSDEEPWLLLSQMVEVRSPWLSVIGERLRDATGREREYWRVEKPDSLLVITIQDGRLLLPARSYRPGVGRTTLDFAGGRLQDPSMIRRRRRRSYGENSTWAAVISSLLWKS